MTEFASAMSIKIRRGEMSSAEKVAVNAQWRDFSETRLAALSVTDADFKTAANFADRHDLNLSASDALHIAIAARHGCTLVTLDRVMADAALACGVPVANIAA